MEELALIAVGDFSKGEARVEKTGIETDEGDLGSAWSISGGFPLEDVDKDLLNASMLKRNRKRKLRKVEIGGVGKCDWMKERGWCGVVKEMDRLVTFFLADLIVSHLRPPSLAMVIIVRRNGGTDSRLLSRKRRPSNRLREFWLTFEEKDGSAQRGVRSQQMRTRSTQVKK